MLKYVLKTMIIKEDEPFEVPEKAIDIKVIGKLMTLSQKGHDTTYTVYYLMEVK